MGPACCHNVFATCHGPGRMNSGTLNIQQHRAQTIAAPNNTTKGAHRSITRSLTLIVAPALGSSHSSERGAAHVQEPLSDRVRLLREEWRHDRSKYDLGKTSSVFLMLSLIVYRAG